eukprot:CAMPEP_0116131464 /NCGR_PEP_ID=MMETSP0329-20121206/9018_1 /TAXON_ID=697910 /ORGANISM="Pseudo-nitzschia arenysensis, Strain B593" /LENGTH=972 /DNA_ID=CAMNT_0003625893 /DNA_START=124 /DNA_END=3042 /DNA_ORIENTATION=+
MADSTKKRLSSLGLLRSFDRASSMKSSDAMSSTAARTSLTSTNRKIEEHDRKSAVVVRRLKIAILTFFALTAIGVATAFSVYRHYNKKSQEQEFRDRFQQDATNTLASLGTNIDSTLSAADAFAISMLSEAKLTNQTFPFVTIGDFAVKASKLKKNTRAKYVCTYQLVEEEQRKEWEAYAPDHTEWIEDALEVQNRDRNFLKKGLNTTKEFMEENYMGHYDLIHGYGELFYGWGGNSTTGVSHEGPYLPMWQQTPAIPIYPLYNWDLSTAAFKDAWYAVIETHLVTITEPYMIAWPWDIAKQEENEAEAEWLQQLLEPGENPIEPISDIYYPVIVEALDNVYHREEDLDAEDYVLEDNHVGAYLALTFYWRDALRDLLPEGSAGVAISFENACDVPPFTYEITGPTPKYLGTGYYNSTFAGNDELYVETNLMDVWSFGVHESAYNGIPINEDLCPFTLKLYPPEAAHIEFMENNDNTVYIVLLLVMSIAVLAILFTLLFFFLYDRLVRNEIQGKINLLDAKRNFVRFVSHEVRTPLNTVSMGLTLMHQDIKKREKNANGEMESLVTADDLARWSTLTGEVTNNAEIAVGVLNDLLNIDKIQMGAFKLEMEILPIWDIIEETTNEFKMMAAKNRTDLDLDLSGLVEAQGTESAIDTTTAKTLPLKILNQRLIGDQTRMQQVLRNLLSNAIKFSKNRGVTVRVYLRDTATASSNTKMQVPKEFRLADDTIVTLPMSGRIVIDVIDTGVGMTEAQLETVFDAGTQFNANKLQSGGGSGLGLAFAKAIAEQHGGSLRAYSGGKDKGTTFRLDLPLYHSDPTTPKKDDETKPDANDSSTRSNQEQLQPMRMLVVDDAPLNRKLLIRLLESNGHSCGQAENGQRLIDTIHESLANMDVDSNQYDCVLVDYEMPVMNGPDAVKAIREIGYTGFVVGVTGNLLPEDVGYFLDCGADAVLGKPFKYKDLEQLLMEHGLFDV